MWKPTFEEISIFKRLNQEKTEKKNEYYTTMIPIVLERANDYCKRKFETTDIPSGVCLFIAGVIQFNDKKQGLSGRSMGSVSYSYDVEIPQTLFKHLAPYRRLSWNG
ncbi:gp6-like head-tail connector protein [Psychrobacillus insolitus]|uniref:Gp6-like head-tail connector protein n=1 Tax=Psychrobacillus insolitus TaxID=1461 RepID=A0A2W7N789_9BACI|nr:phage head-tail connector protein [Psychrobacillus insolitus]PZX07903.1 gp6-like head-tail connector protein [Psychrobacillus insolitus]